MGAISPPFPDVANRSRSPPWLEFENLGRNYKTLCSLRWAGGRWAGGKDDGEDVRGAAEGAGRRGRGPR